MPSDNKSTGTSWTSMPGMQQILGTANNLFNSGAAWAPNTTSMVSPFAKQTRSGLSGMESVAKSAVSPFAQNFSRVRGVVNDGGLNNLQDRTVSRLQSMAGGNGLSGDQQQALDWLKTTATGNPAQNPYLDDIINRSSDDIRLQTGLMASGMGRYGSGGHEGVLANSIGDMSSKMRYTDFGNQQARQDAAVRDFSNLATTGQNQLKDTLGSLFNAGTMQRQNVLDGTQQLRDAYDARMDPYRTMTGVGNAYENKNTQVLQDQARQFQERKNALTDPVNWLANVAGAFQGGQQVQSAPSNPWAQGIGGGLAAYGATGNPLLGLLGGIGGFL
jgi:hypothetical protein